MISYNQNAIKSKQFEGEKEKSILHLLYFILKLYVGIAKRFMLLLTDQTVFISIFDNHK